MPGVGAVQPLSGPSPERLPMEYQGSSITRGVIVVLLGLVLVGIVIFAVGMASEVF